MSEGVMGKEKLAGLAAGGIVTPHSFPLRFTNLISELPLMESVFILLC